MEEIGVEKKPVIGGVWCLSNTERLVMIPLAPHTERERQREGGRERETYRRKEGQWESEGREASAMETGRETAGKAKTVRGAEQENKQEGVRKKTGRRTLNKQRSKASVKRLVHPHNDHNYR